MPHFEALEQRAMLSLADLAAARISSVAVQSDSKIIVAGSIGDTGAVDFFLARFNSNGSLDSTFGDGGTVRTDFGSDDTCNDVAIDSQGRIIAAGGGGLKHDFAVARYLPNGSLDTSFSGGKRLIAFGGHDRALTIAIAPADKVLLAGRRDGHGLLPEYAAPLARLNSDGTFDSSFDGDGTELLSVPLPMEDGRVNWDAAINVEAINDIEVASDGKILLALDAFYSNAQDRSPFAVRLLANGVVDISFINGGFDAPETEYTANAVGEPEPGIVWLAMTSDYARSYPGSRIYEIAGQTEQRVTQPELTDFGTEILRLLTQPDGRVVVAASAYFPPRFPDAEFDERQGLLFARLKYLENSSATFDSSFGDNGIAELNFQRLFTLKGAALDPQRRIVGAGETDDGDLIIVRYDSTGHLDSSFSGTGILKIGTATVSGRVFNDTNANGIFDGSDTGLSGFRVFLDEAPFNGVIDAGEVSRPVSGAGTYTFSNVPGGTYRVRVAPREGWRQSSPALGYYEINLGAGQTARSLSFACADTVVIKGSDFMDANKNRVRDAAEAGLSGWYVYIDRNNDGIIDKRDTWTVTDANGNYRFFNLPAGTYVVRVVPNARYRQTAPASGYHKVTLAAGTSISNRNFGEKRIA
jgi:uncharacterized delta-60 repeat protein